MPRRSAFVRCRATTARPFPPPMARSRRRPPSSAASRSAASPSTTCRRWCCRTRPWGRICSASRSCRGSRIASPGNAPGAPVIASLGCFRCIMAPLPLPHHPASSRWPPSPRTPSCAPPPAATLSSDAAAFAIARPRRRRAAPPAAAQTTRATYATARPRTSCATAPSLLQTGQDAVAAVCLLFRSCRRPHLALLPRGPQTGEELLKRWLLDRGHHLRRIGDLDKPLLHCPNVTEQAHRIELGALRFNLAFYLFRRPRVGDQPLIWRGWRVIALVHLRALARLLRELERRLEKIHEQTHRHIQLRQRRRGRQPLEAPVAHDPAYHRPVLLLHPGLVVLAIRTAARERDSGR